MSLWVKLSKLKELAVSELSKFFSRQVIEVITIPWVGQVTLGRKMDF